MPDTYTHLMALADAATQGPWLVEQDTVFARDVFEHLQNFSCKRVARCAAYHGDVQGMKDAAFIASIHEFANLCRGQHAEIARLEQEEQALRRHIDRMASRPSDPKLVALAKQYGEALEYGRMQDETIAELRARLS